MASAVMNLTLATRLINGRLALPLLTALLAPAAMAQQLRQLLHQQPKQQPGSDSEAGEFLPAGLVQLRQLLRKNP